MTNPPTDRERDWRAALEAYKTEGTLVDPSYNGMGRDDCGCYGDSGPLTIPCERHDPEKLIDLLASRLAEVEKELEDEAQDKAAVHDLYEQERALADELADLVAELEEYITDFEADADRLERIQAALARHHERRRDS